MWLTIPSIIHFTALRRRFWQLSVTVTLLLLISLKVHFRAWQYGFCQLINLFDRKCLWVSLVNCHIRQKLKIPQKKPSNLIEKPLTVGKIRKNPLYSSIVPFLIVLVLSTSDASWKMSFVNCHTRYNCQNVNYKMMQFYFNRKTWKSFFECYPCSVMC